MSEAANEAPNEAANEALRLEGIVRTFQQGRKAVEVLRGAELAIAPGETVALVAPSGAGKSTLLHIAGLLDTPTAGAVSIEGNRLSGLDEGARTAARRRLLGFVYQFHHLLPEFTAEENVAIPVMAAGRGAAAARARAAELLGRVGLDDRRRHRPAELSGGEQQRVAICRALANQPRVLLADEPTGNLDPETAGRVFDMLLEVVRETGLAALIATHNVQLAGRMDRVLRLEGGRIRAA
ncbi:MAG TPA: ABC transporter ATP-binding protein [Thermohalobaculum sp.]|nr:ABC transporter ATP-binding protein [Thermohalobaculum sp.]